MQEPDLQPALRVERTEVDFADDRWFRTLDLQDLPLHCFAFLVQRTLCNAATRTATRGERRRPCLRCIVLVVDFLQLPQPANADPDTNTNAVKMRLNNLFMRISLSLNEY